MGNAISEYLGFDLDRTPSLKLESQTVEKFSGTSNDFPHWKNQTLVAFNATGYRKVLANEDYALAHPKLNSMVFAQLSLACGSGSANHLIRSCSDDENGYKAWGNLMDWYEGSRLSLQSANRIRAKLTGLLLVDGGSATDYINNFETWHADLEAINNGEEAYTSSTKLQNFMLNIRHSKYQAAIEACKLAPVLTIQMAIDRIREKELELEDQHKAKRKFSIMRRQETPYESSDTQYYLPPYERVTRPGSPSPYATTATPVTPSPGRNLAKRRKVEQSKLPSEIVLRQSGAIRIISPHSWRDLTDSDKAFVRSWNGRVRHGEGTDACQIPPGVTILPNQADTKKGNLKKARRQSQDDHQRKPTSRMLDVDNKRIHFNLQESHYDDYEDVDPELED
eukprot:scaffold2267_cov92-Cylindrotheca_fusiformis.AAC.2